MAGVLHGEFGWQDLSGNVIRDLSKGDLRSMLWNIAWRRVKDGWLKELNEKPKLSMLKMLVDCGVESSCAYVKSKSERRIWMKLRGGTVPLQIEMGRWQGIRWEEQLCKQCDSGVVEDVYHWMVECNACLWQCEGTSTGTHAWKTLMMALTRRPRSRRLHPSSQMHVPTTNY